MGLAKQRFAEQAERRKIPLGFAMTGVLSAG
jgi:hypothetical protein